MKLLQYRKPKSFRNKALVKKKCLRFWYPLSAEWQQNYASQAEKMSFYYSSSQT